MSQTDTHFARKLGDSTTDSAPPYQYRQFQKQRTPAARREGIGRDVPMAVLVVQGCDGIGVPLERVGTVLRGVGLLDRRGQATGVPSTRDDFSRDLFAGGYWTAQLKLPTRSVKMPAEITAFCRREGIRQAVDNTVELIEDCFAPVQQPTYRLSISPDDGTQKVVIRFTTELSHDAALDAYDHFIAIWVELIDQAARDHMRVSYDIAHHESEQVS